MRVRRPTTKSFGRFREDNNIIYTEKDEYSWVLVLQINRDDDVAGMGPCEFCFLIDQIPTIYNSPFHSKPCERNKSWKSPSCWYPKSFRIFLSTSYPSQSSLQVYDERVYSFILHNFISRTMFNSHLHRHSAGKRNGQNHGYAESKQLLAPLLELHREISNLMTFYLGKKD
jgi:hypothetical protein